MPRPRSGPRATGPYYCTVRNRYRIFLYQGPGLKPEVLWFDTEQAALAGLHHATEQLSQTSSRCLSAVLDEYLTDKERRGLAKPATCTNQRGSFLHFFAGHLEQDIARMTPQHAEALYERSVTTPTQRGTPVAAASHHLYLDLAKALFKWSVRRGYVRHNPFAEVRKIGRASTGKPQHRLDEAKRYLAAALRLFDQGDRMALAAVVPLYLGLRPGEVLARRVRDVDSSGAVLWIDTGKSKNARRHLNIKAAPLRERLEKLTANRALEEPLFCVHPSGNPPRISTMREAVRRVCAAAAVPVVCPHSLRGLWATLSIESGAAEGAVAAALGHGSFEMTAKHYTQPEALIGARSARVLDLLEAPDADTVDGLSAEQLAAKLPPGMLLKLAALANPELPPSPGLGPKPLRA